MEIEEQDFQNLINAYRNNSIDNLLLNKFFSKFVKLVGDYKKISISQVVIDEIASLLISKLEKYDKNYSAYNFFLTITCCYLKQLLRGQSEIKSTNRI